MARIAMSARKAAYILFEAGLNPEVVQEGINTIPQPSKGFYYPEDVNNFITEKGL